MQRDISDYCKENRLNGGEASGGEAKPHASGENTARFNTTARMTADVYIEFVKNKNPLNQNHPSKGWFALRV